VAIRPPPASTAGLHCLPVRHSLRCTAWRQLLLRRRSPVRLRGRGQCVLHVLCRAVSTGVLEPCPRRSMEPGHAGAQLQHHDSSTTAAIRVVCRLWCWITHDC
jgi:hypothetical protein